MRDDHNGGNGPQEPHQGDVDQAHAEHESARRKKAGELAQDALAPLREACGNDFVAVVAVSPVTANGNEPAVVDAVDNSHDGFPSAELFMHLVEQLCHHMAGEPTEQVGNSGVNKIMHADSGVIVKTIRRITPGNFAWAQFASPTARRIIEQVHAEAVAEDSVETQAITSRLLEEITGKKPPEEGV